MEQRLEDPGREARGTGPAGPAGLEGPVRPMRSDSTLHPARSNHALCIGLFALTFPLSGSAAPLVLSQQPGNTPSTGTVTSSLAVNAMTTRSDTAMFVASYEPVQWTGAVTAFTVAARTGAVSTTGLWGTVPASGTRAAGPVSTATLLDDASFVPFDRLVLSSATGGVVDGVGAGISWRWDSLAADARKALNTFGGKDDAQGNQRLDYLRGERTQERPGGGVFRQRASRQGDIVNSKLWHLARLPDSGYSANGYAAFKTGWGTRAAMLYVGANDGMLHGFSAATGQEKIAYVPFGLHARLPWLTNADASGKSTHRYFVDGSPFTADLHVDSSWKTYLAGFPGLGGKGYFVLDVTDPAAFSAGNAARLVVLDHTSGIDADIGHITGEPVRGHDNTALTRQISQLNNGRWALITGNGYNSANETAVLLIQYLDKARELKRIPAILAATGGVPTGNGLSAPRLIDLNGDKIPDIAYAGDLLGNLWKFDLSSGDPAAWATAFGGAPLYATRDAGSPEKSQPITSAPVWVAHPQGGVMVVFGTGRNLTDADRTDASTHTIYGVHDDTAIMRDAGKVKLVPGRPVPAGRGTLVQQEISPNPTATGIAGTGVTGSPGALWTVSSRPVPATGASASARKGWYLDLPPGERVLGNPGWFEGQLIDVASIVPATGRTWLTTLNAINGHAPRSQIYASAPVVATPPTSATESPTGTASRLETGLRTALTHSPDRSEKGLCAPGTNCTDRLLLPPVALRPSWRQLQ